MRFRFEAGAALEDLPQPAVFCVWHNRLAVCLALYRRIALAHAPGRKLAALVSASRDGGMLARALELYGVQPVRGSSSRRGPQALRELTTWAKRGYDLAVTPDGPRGPRYHAQEGVLALAQLTGGPIIPIGCFYSRKIVLKSWDGFQIPLPFTVCRVQIGAPFHVPRDASPEEREELRKRLEAELRRIAVD